MSVCAHVHMRVRLDVVLYMCMYVYVCGSLLWALCVCLCVHRTDTVTSPSVVLLIVQMVKLAAPTKQQSIYSNKSTHTELHTNHLLGLLIQTTHVHTC